MVESRQKAKRWGADALGRIGINIDKGSLKRGYRTIRRHLYTCYY